jgi:hypothetical protein
VGVTQVPACERIRLKIHEKEFQASFQELKVKMSDILWVHVISYNTKSDAET